MITGNEVRIVHALPGRVRLKVAANAAVEAAGGISKAALGTVRDMLVDLVSGAKEVAGTALPKSSPPSTEA